MSTSRWNVPNALSLVRLAGTPVLFLLVHRESVTWFVAGYAILGLTDFLDGAIARAWKQTSTFGALLDSIADVAYYVSTAYFALTLFPEYVLPNLVYIAMCVVLLVIQVLASRLMLGRVIMPHTHLSRLAGVLAVVVFFLSFLMDTTGLFRAVMLIYSVAFIEMVLMFRLYGEVSPDRRSILPLRGRETSASR